MANTYYRSQSMGQFDCLESCGKSRDSIEIFRFLGIGFAILLNFGKACSASIAIAFAFEESRTLL
jgi:hypothetical protein